MYINYIMNKNMYSKKSLLLAFTFGGMFSLTLMDIYLKYNDEFKLIRIIKKD